MKETDYASVHTLWMHTSGMGLNTLDDSYEGIQRFLKRNPTTCLLAVENENIVGVILCGHDGRRGYIYHMAVADTHQRHGIGGHLLQSAINALKKEDIYKVALVVFQRNEKGNQFWQKHGFEVREDLHYRNKAMVALQRIDT